MAERTVWLAGRHLSVRTLIGGLVVFALSGCGGVLSPKGPVGAANREILLNSLAIMLVIVVPTIIGTLAFAWWYRQSNTRAVRHPGFVFSGRIELLVWSVPVLIVLLLAGVTWVGAHRLDPAKPLESDRKPLEVQVVSMDWKWLFIYPEQGVASVNELVIPAGVPVHFSLTSSSVMNTFFVPQLGSMIYTMNGMATQLYLQADEPGTFHGQSSHFSGDGFADMDFQTRAVDDAGFAKWIRSSRSNGPLLDARTYTLLARQSLNVRPFTFSAVQPRLFDAVVMQGLAPGPGPKQTISPKSGG